MRSILVVTLSLLTLSACLSVAVADPYVSVWSESKTSEALTSSWYGNSGLIMTPSARTLPVAKANVTFHRVQRDTGDLDFWGINFGLLDNLEIGGSRIDLAGGGSEEVAHLKYRVDTRKLFQRPEFPDLAIGVTDVTNEVNRGYYVVLSQTMPLGPDPDSRGLTLHLGLADNKANVGAMNGLFGGLEFSALRKAIVQLEHDGDNFNAAVRYQLADSISLDAGLLDSDFGFGVTYRSGF